MGLALKELRLKAGLQQSELGKLVGVSNRVISAWERGETQLTINDACKIATALGCTLDELAGRRPKASTRASPATTAPWDRRAEPRWSPRATRWPRGSRQAPRKSVWGGPSMSRFLPLTGWQRRSRNVQFEEI